MTGTDNASGVIRARSHALFAVILTAIIAAFDLSTTFQPVRLTKPWTFERVYGLPDSKSLAVALSVFFWCFVLWILFCFYKSARWKYERLLFASCAVGFVFSLLKRFMPPLIAVNLQFLSTAATLVSVLAAITLVFTLPPKNNDGSVVRDTNC